MRAEFSLLHVGLCCLSLLHSGCFSQQSSSSARTKQQKYILYDVNPGEGFNLRRDVYMRIAVLVRKLNLDNPSIDFTLVLPPWGHLYHWQTEELGLQAKIPWSHFFDVESLSKFVPVMELTDFLAQQGLIIDHVYYLQMFKDGWKDGKFEQKYEVAPCLDQPRYRKDVDGNYAGTFWYFNTIRSRTFECMSVQGHTEVISKFLVDLEGESVMLDRAETLLHDWFGDAMYWGARRSMRFADHLVDIASEFRKKELKSSDESDQTVQNEDWRKHRSNRKERGGDYMCVHLRRKDYVQSRAGHIPTIQDAARQLTSRMSKLNLTTLFVSTDAPQQEFQQLRDLMPDVSVVKFEPATEILDLYLDGGVAIIDQIICSHARHFVGSYESTFTFRIQEEREIMGFPVQATFDMLCNDESSECEGGSKWTIDWGSDEDWKLPPRGQAIQGHHLEL